MLLELRAENYAVMDHAIAGFGPGLNLLTGETGAGKSILVDALALLMGQKASAGLIRHGADRAVVSCVFESTPGAARLLDANGIDPDGDEIILRREILADGRGRVYVNNQPATVSVLRALAPELALIHAQSETLAGFDPAQQRLLLDRFAGLSPEETAVAFTRWRAVQNRLAEMERDEKDRLRLADLWTFQAREIHAADPQPGEDEALATEKRVLLNAERLQAAALSASEVLYENDASAESTLQAAQKHLEELARYDSQFHEPVSQLIAARATIQDISSSLRHYADRIDASPERLAEVESRLASLDRLKRKYGPTLADVIAAGEEADRRLAETENRDEVLQSLRAELLQAASAYTAAARSVTQQRLAAAKKLEKSAESHINDLAMKARFAVAVTPSEDPSAWTAQGWDTVECRISTNPGEPLQPLDQIASGGEMSRVLLALKVSVEEGANRARDRKVQIPRTLVFDEIDIGIGGRAAEAVGQKLRALSRAQQVLCVTHLPQIAAFADQHFLVEKQEKQRRTHTSVRLLTPAERAEEIARMISGATVTDTSLRHAEQMLKTASP